MYQGIYLMGNACMYTRLSGAVIAIETAIDLFYTLQPIAM